MKWQRVFTGLACSLAAVACLDLGEWSWDEVARAPSPVGVDAVVIESNGGATTSFGYDVYVVANAQSVERNAAGSVAYLYGARRSDSAYGVTLRWQDSTHLVLEYLRAQEVRLNDSLVTVAGRLIHVVLRAGIADPTAPTGGMLWNK
jgi:hypothetical protein